MGQVNNSSSASSGIGFIGLLTIVFITLKLTGVIAWPWIWVLAPLWIGFLLSFGIVLLFLIVIGIAMFFDRNN